MKVILNNEIIFRKEFFGGLLYNHLTKSYHQYNEDGTWLIYKFLYPQNIDEIVDNLNTDFNIDKNEIRNFINQLISDKILVTASSHSDKSECLTYFFDVKDQREDCFYAPTTMSIYITYKCTKECIHCVNSASPKKDTKNELSTNDWLNLLKQMRDVGVIYLVFTGGEIFTRKDWFEIVSYADELKFSYALLTDFDYLGDGEIERLKKLNYIDHILISLDGATSETHDFIRGKGAFERSLKKLEVLKNSGLLFNISTTVHKNNKHELDKIVDLAKNYNANAIWFNPLAPFGRGEDLKEIVLSEEELTELSFSYLNIIENSEIKPGNEFWSLLSEDKDRKDKFNPLKGNPYSISLAIYNFSLDAYGDCYLDSKLRARNILPLGNIKNSNILELWNSEKLTPLRNQYSFGNFTFKDIREIDAQISENL